MLFFVDAYVCCTIQLSPSSERHTASHQINNTSSTPSLAVSANASGCNGTAKPRARARRGQATDPHSIAERVSMRYIVMSYCGVLGQPMKFTYVFYLVFFMVYFLTRIFFRQFIFCCMIWFPRTIFSSVGINYLVQLRREKIAERMKNLQELVPSSNKVLLIIISSI